MRLAILGLASCLLALGGASSAIAMQQPYAGQEQRAIKALSEQEVADILGGRGMGYAKAAELNGYPGPSHVLELKSELSLSEEQIRQMEALFAAMQADAIEAGKAYLAAEKQLEAAFASANVSPEMLDDLIMTAAESEARVRRVHLETHLKTLPLLTPEQVSTYNRLRGYAAGASGSGHQGGHKHH